MPESCIYCSREIDPSRGEGDHIIPAAFGEFDEARRFRQICVECNSSLKVHEEELIRCSPSAIVRGLVGAMQSRRGAPIGRRGARGARPPTLFALHSDHKELVREDPLSRGSVVPVDQLIIQTKSGATQWIELFPAMTARAVRKRLEDLGVPGADIECIRYKVSEATYESTRRLIEALCPGSPHEELEPVEAGVRRTQVRIEFDSGIPTQRAIAKVALHYYLAYSDAGFSGHEVQFDAVKRFIHGEGEGQGVLVRDAFSLPLPAELIAKPAIASWTRYEHLVCVEEGPGFATVGVCMGFGREIPPTPSFVVLFSMPQATGFYLRTRRFGHRFVYRQSARPGKRAGHVEAVGEW